MATGAELITLIRDRAELDTNHSALTDTVLLRWINQGLNRLSLIADWPWLRATETNSSAIAGTEQLTLPTGWLRTILLTHVDTAEPLGRAHLKMIRRILPSQQGRPQVYAADGSRVFIRPVPNAAFSFVHDYVRSEPALGSTSASPLLPDAYNQMLIEWVAAKAFQKDRKTDKAQDAKADFFAAVKDARDNINQGREPLSISVRPGAWF